MKVANAGIQRSANIADEEKRSYFVLTVVKLWGLFILLVSQSREKAQQWLSPSPPDPSTNHNIARKAYHSGTTSWFFQGSIFEEWKSSPSLLWVHGKRTSLLSTTPHPTDSHLCSGLRQKRPVVCYFVLFLPTSTQIIAQLWNNRRHYDSMRSRISNCSLLLLRFSRRR